MTPTELIWAFIGLLLTIGGTWVEANIVAWDWWLLLLPTIVALVLSGVAEAFRNIRKP